MELIGTLLLIVINIARWILIARFIVDLVQGLSPEYKPKGIVLVLFIFVLRITDPLVRSVRKVIKPARAGNVMFDFSLLILLVALLVLELVVLGIFR